MNKLVQVKNIYKTFAGLNAVDGVSLEIDQGQFFSLLGPSGCGKTTLLRLIAGFEKPSSGEVVIDNLHMEGVVPNQRPTNMVFQNYAIFPHLNVEQNVAYGLHKKRLSKVEKTKMINEVLDLVGLSGFNHRAASAMSGGQKQRISIARAIIKQPKLMIFDDCLSAVDTETEETILNNLNRIGQKSTRIIISHRVSSVKNANKVIVLDKGEIVEEGTHNELLSRKGLYFDIYLGRLNGSDRVY